MSKIRKSARMQECTLMIPGVCNHNPETVVLAHAPHRDKGMGYKGPDDWAAYCCSSCHDYLDGRLHTNDSVEDKLVAWYWGVQKTQSLLKEQGLL